MKNNKEISHKNIKDWLKEDPGTQPSDTEIHQTEDALIAFAGAHATEPPPDLREKILGKLTRLNALRKQRQHLDPGHLPLLEESATFLDWQAAVAGIEPPEDFENIHLHTLESNEKRELFVAWVKEYVEEEVHYDLLESFLILEGACECHITGEDGNTRIVRMGQGDFITMQVGETHGIRITSLKPAKAILQWQKLAA